ncbi:hypothetical protein [Candidatus Protochlamydia phocaeensis]|uniref:hypothetical protein n=1 Tax=Candidatus Protochlamydia phocaeensis TaxID=1414722 RepID=UPI00083991F3|nr:hypothetical protein [Candidatus Protochlamydia phocaeensis]
MKKREIIALACLGVMMAAVIPADLLAETTDSFDFADSLKSNSAKIQNLFLGNFAPLLGVVGGVYGIYQSVIHSTPQPLFTYGGIGLAVGFMPTFIKSVFNLSTMLLP